MRWTVALFSVLLVGGCMSSQLEPASGPPVTSASATTSSSPDETGQPTIGSPAPTRSQASPTATVGTAPSLAADSIAVVVTDDLRVRSMPGVSPQSLLLTPLLDAGRRVFVVDGPVQASGFTWYQVQPLAEQNPAEELPFGWVAAADKNGEPWLSSEGFTCPDPPEGYASLVTMPRLVWLSCFGDLELTVATRIADPEATCGLDIGWTIEPTWLAGTCPKPDFILHHDERDGLELFSHIEPGVDLTGLDPGPEEPDWIDVLVTGHLDHAAARTCRGRSEGEPVPLSAAEIVMRCRSEFVITKIEPDGYLP